MPRPETFFLAAGTALLFGWRVPPALYAAGRMDRAKTVFSEALALFALTLASWIVTTSVLSSCGESAALYRVPATALIVLALNRATTHPGFFAPVLALVLFLFDRPPGTRPGIVVFFVLIFLLVRFGTAALRQRLVFSSVPRPMQGLPAALLAVALYLLALAPLVYRLDF